MAMETVRLSCPLTRVARPFAIMGSPGAETGRVEAMGFDGLTGRNFAAGARPPNLGLAILRFRRRGTETPGGASVVIAPYGQVRIAQRHSPDGVVAELICG